MLQEKNIHDTLFEQLLQQNSRCADEKRVLIDNYKSMGFPSKALEEWKYTDLSDVFEKSYELPTFPNITEDKISALMPISSGIQIVFVNGIFTPKLSKISYQGISVESLKDSCRREACGFNATFNATKISEHGKFEMLNTIFANEGVIVRIARNIKVTEPITVLFLQTGSEQIFTQTRNIIVCDANAAVAFTAFHCNTGKSKSTANIATEILVKENANVTYTQIYNQSPENTDVHAIEVKQDAGSIFTGNSFLVSGGIIRNNIRISHAGEHCETILNGLYLPTQTEQHDSFVQVKHMHPECTTNELYKGVASHTAVGTFVGNIYVAKDAQKTVARQSNRNILLSNDATIHSKPQLEIWADDVSCNHGSSIGQLSADQLFYCQSRGISRDQAAILLMHAFVSEVVEKLDNDELKAYIYQLIESKERF